MNEVRYLEENGRYYIQYRKATSLTVLASVMYTNKVMWKSSSAQKLLRKIVYDQLLKERDTFSFQEIKTD